MRSVILALSTFALTSCLEGELSVPGEASDCPDAAGDPGSEDPGEDELPEEVEPCALVGTAQVDALADRLEEALAAALADEAANAETGAYGGAATYGREYLEAGLDELERLRAWMDEGGDGDPTVTTPAEGYQIAGMLWTSVQSVQYGVHWSSVSAAWHDPNVEAVAAMEGGLAVEQEAAALRQAALQCYLSPVTAGE